MYKVVDILELTKEEEIEMNKRCGDEHNVGFSFQNFLNDMYIKGWEFVSVIEDTGVLFIRHKIEESVVIEKKD